MAVIAPLGDAGWLVTLGDAIDGALVARVQELARRLRESAPGAVRDVVPAYASVAVHVDADALAAQPGLMSLVEAWCADIVAGGVDAGTMAAGRLGEIPVAYGGEAGPDLAHVAAHAGLAEAEVIARHANVDYRVAMLGFAPGFPYLVGLNPALATPRHAQPRQRVAAGSVGIGGAQTGVYPRASPGGWQIIGRTDLVLFDPARAEPSLLQPGDRVRFVPRP